MGTSKRNQIGFALSVAAVLAFGLPGASAETLRVPSQYATIQAGIDAADPNDVVLVADGTYTGRGNKDVDFRGKEITVRSENGPDNCIIDCKGNGRGFNFHSGETREAVVDGFTITHGTAAGGAVYCQNSSPTITNCTIKENGLPPPSPFNGGGIYCYNESHPTIINCTITQNLAKNGAGIYCGNGSNPTVTNCTITDNEAAYNGGGVCCANGSNPTITDCTIIGNTAAYSGGGVGCRAGSGARITDCTIKENSAKGSGGGIALDSGDLTIRNCTITGNVADANGGGISLGNSKNPTIANCAIVGNTAGANGGGVFSEWYSSPKITNCTITGNTANDYGGGFYSRGPQSNPTITNCILWGDSAAQGPEIALFGDPWLSSALTISYSDVQGGAATVHAEPGCLNWGDGNIDADPRFIDPNDPNSPNYRQMPCSPVIDAADNTAVPAGITTDLDGNPRFVDDPKMPDTGRRVDPNDPNDPIVDMGAYEFQANCMGDLDGDRVVDARDLTLLLASWWKGVGGDLNCDGKTDAQDLTLVLANWFKNCP